MPRLPARSHIYLTHEQVDELADACDEYRTLVLVLAYGGLRFGEAAALRTRNVDRDCAVGYRCRVNDRNRRTCDVQ